MAKETKMQTKKKKQLATFLGGREVRPGRNGEGGGWLITILIKL